MIDARFVYMERPKGAFYRTAKFKAPYGNTLRLLEAELKHLGAKSIVIQAGFRNVRNDGWPYSAAKAEHPSVCLSFTDRKGNVLSFRGTRYTTYDDNLRAIALSLEALRAVDRYGVVEGAQYAGFKAIAAPAAVTREEKVANLAANGATPGERAAAQAALDRMKEA